MPHVAAHDLTAFLQTFGYWAVLIFVMIESTGIPFPGETILLTAAIYAGTTHRLSVVFIVAAAAAGAIIGDNVGYWVGREGGYRLVRRFGPKVHLDERKLKVGQYLFRRHGGKVVFFGRFVAVLRAWAAFLAGLNRMDWPRFLIYNAAGAVVWSALYGSGAYFLGEQVHALAGTAGKAFAAVAAVAIIGGLVFLRRNEARLEDEAERALPGPPDRRLAHGRSQP